MSLSAAMFRHRDCKQADRSSRAGGGEEAAGVSIELGKIDGLLLSTAGIFSLDFFK